jgi:hypothetical protein
MSLEIIDALKLNINRDINPRLHGNIAFNTSWEII